MFEMQIGRKGGCYWLGDSSLTVDHDFHAGDQNESGVWADNLEAKELQSSASKRMSSLDWCTVAPVRIMGFLGNM